jgi:hypothetical protein
LTSGPIKRRSIEVPAVRFTRLRADLPGEPTLVLELLRFPGVHIIAGEQVRHGVRRSLPERPIDSEEAQAIWREVAVAIRSGATSGDAGSIVLTVEGRDCGTVRVAPEALASDGAWRTVAELFDRIAIAAGLPLAPAGGREPG